MNHTDYMTGAELQALREACGLDRDQFGEMCGVQGRSIKYWEMGQTNHGVPADVEALVLDLVGKNSAQRHDMTAIARNLFSDLRLNGRNVRQIAELLLEMDDKVSREAETEIKRLTSAANVVLMRTADPLKTEVSSRVYMALRRICQNVRLVSFDYKAYRAQLSGQDTPESRQAWARRALKEQAKPHKQDQPV